MARDIIERLTWPNSAAAGTVRETVGSDAHMPGVAVVLLHNPSASALTVKCLLRWTDTGDVDRDALLRTYTVAAGATTAEQVESLGMGTPVIRVSNDTAISASGGFDAELRVEFVGS